MNDEIKLVCDMTVGNYKIATKGLRYDGDYINHFSALINGYNRKCIPVDEVKEIRSIIKSKTSNMSVFRGDMLYIVSFLIALYEKEDRKVIIDDIINTFDLLVEEGFNESEYLILSAYSIVRYVKLKYRKLVIKRARNIFNIIKYRHGNYTGEDDYLLCTLLAIDNNDIDNLNATINSLFESMSNLKMYSNNEIQSLTNSILLNKDRDVKENVIDLLIGLDKNNLKLSHNFPQALGIMIKKQNVDKSIHLMKQVTEYLCMAEAEYDFYIDKCFRNLIALTIVFMSERKNRKQINYSDEILAFCTYSFILTKNQGLFNEILA